jgi:hypothetical protein
MRMLFYELLTLAFYTSPFPEKTISSLNLYYLRSISAGKHVLTVITLPYFLMLQVWVYETGGDSCLPFY